jgi:hypothetical protein
MKTGLGALGTAEKESGSVKYENGTRRPRYRSKMSQDTQNLKTGPDALVIAENESGRAKHETGTDALRTVENEFGSAKHEIETRRPPYRRKRARERKT